MTVIVCLDAHNGLLFNGRRQSRDRLVIEDILSTVRGRRLLAAPFSAPLFAGAELLLDEAFLTLAEAEDFCFVEDRALMPQLTRIDALLVYRWNRAYPADVFFDLPLETWRLVETTEFKGTSHECITREVYLP